MSSPSVWQQVLAWLGLSESEVSRAARLEFERIYGYRALDARLRKQETTRSVIAVFYRDPKGPSRASPYKLFAVSNDLSEVEELPCDPTSPYWIRGRK